MSSELNPTEVGVAPEETVETPVAEPTVTEVKKVEETKVEDPKDGKTVLEESRKWEARSKANHAEAEELKVKVSTISQEFETVKESESKVRTELSEIQSQLNAKVSEVARYKAALANGLSGEDIEFITGSSEEEITASAKKFAARIGSSTGRVSLRTQGADSTNSRPLTLNERLEEKIRTAASKNK